MNARPTGWLTQDDTTQARKNRLLRAARPNSATDPSRRVLGVEPDVLVGQIAGPESASSGPEREAQPQLDVALALQVRRGGGGVERLRHALVVEQHVAQP